MNKKYFRSIKKVPTKLKTENGLILFNLARSRKRKSISISIDKQGSVCVYCPFEIEDDRVFSFIKEKSKWITSKIKEVQKNKEYICSKDFSGGSEFLFLGKKCKLVIIRKNSKRTDINFDSEKWTIAMSEKLDELSIKNEIKRKLLQWYKIQAKEILGARIFKFSRLIGVQPKVIQIRTQKRIWGNCNYSNKKIHLNWQIILAPMDVIDYIVVHELCHLIVPNHSKLFWKNVKKILPYCDIQKKWLRDNFLEMALP